MSIDLHPGSGWSATPSAPPTRSPAWRPRTGRGPALARRSHRDLRRAGRAGRGAGGRGCAAAPPGRAAPVAAGRDVDSVVELLAAWRGSPRGAAAAARRRPRAGSREAWPAPAPGGQGVRPAPRPRAADVDLRQHRGRPSWCGSRTTNLASNAAAIADYLAPHRRRRRAHHPAAALLLRALGADQPPARPGAAWCSASGRSPTPASVAAAPRSTASRRSRACPHTFDLLERSGCRDRAARRRCATSPRPGAGWRPRRCGAGPGGAGRGRRPRGDVRPDRGHRADGLAAAGAAERCPDAIGVPIPGGELHVEPSPGSTPTCRPAPASWCTPAPT